MRFIKQPSASLSANIPLLSWTGMTRFWIPRKWLTVKPLRLLLTRNARDILSGKGINTESIKAVLVSDRGRDGELCDCNVILTDEEDVPDAMAQLRKIWPNIMRLDYDNMRTRASSDVGAAEETGRKSEIELFNEFYTAQNGQPLSEEQRAFAEGLLESLKEGMA